jgi:hypothetical protein
LQNNQAIYAFSCQKNGGGSFHLQSFVTFVALSAIFTVVMNQENHHKKVS